MGLFSKIMNFFSENKTQEEFYVPQKASEIKKSTQEEVYVKELLAKEKEYLEKIKNLEDKYDSSCKDYAGQIESLKKQLDKATCGNVDDIVKGKLDEAEKTFQETDKLKKKIANLEEELEETEEDLESVKKKIKAKEAENGQLLDEISRKKKEISQLTEDLSSTKTQLDKKLEELDLKMRSLLFVQEILTAQQTSDASVQQRYKAVDAIADFVDNELWDVFNQINNDSLKSPDFQNQFGHWRAAARKNWLDGKTTIAFVGEFSAGKTSIVNRILSQDDPSVPTLPVSTKATTAIPTYISGSPYMTSYNFLSKDNILKSISEETFKQVSKEVLDQVGGVSSLIENFVMKYKNPNLEELSILDTPGFNSNDPEDARHTLDVINECDALFWVFDVNAGTVNRSSIKLIQQNLKKPLYVVINKVDTKANSDVDKVENLIRNTLTKEGINVEKFIRFSAKSPLSDIMTPITSVPKNDVQIAFVTDLLSLVQKAHAEKKAEMQKANRHYQSLEKKANLLEEQYNQAINQTWNECNEAANLPKWTTHMFSKDRYEMSSWEGQRLRSLLDDIASDKMKLLVTIFNNRVQNAQDIQHAYDELNTIKIHVTLIDHSERQLKKLISSFEKGKKAGVKAESSSRENSQSKENPKMNPRYEQNHEGHDFDPSRINNVLNRLYNNTGSFV